LNSSLVKGKIVVCDGSEGWGEAFRAGALGSIVLEGFTTDQDFIVVLPLPTSALEGSQYLVVRSYVNSTK
jgi:hypothetical protein